MFTHVKSLSSPVIAFFCALLFSNLAFAVPSTMTFQSKIFKPDGTALESAAVNFRFTTLDPTGTCILYVEDFMNQNMQGSAGLVIFNLGTGNKAFPVGASIFSNIFDNLQSSFSCQGGGSFLPGVARTDSRKIVLQFNDGTGSGWQTLPAVDISSVPFANFAGDSQKLAGLDVTQFLRTSALPTCGVGTVLTFDGSSLSCVSSSGGTVTGVGTSAAAGNPITIAGTASVPTVNIQAASTTQNGYLLSSDWNTFNNKQNALGFTPLNRANNLSDIVSVPTARTNLGLGGAAVLNVGTVTGTVAAGDDARFASALQSGAAAGGDLTGTYPNPTLANIVVTGTATKITYDAKGRVTAGAALAAADIPLLDASKITTGLLPIARGGTNSATANGALNNLLPTQTANANKFLQTDGTNTSWVAGNSGTVTNVTGTLPISVTSNSTTPSITIATADTTTTGALSFTDWNIFNNKLTSSLATTKIFVGNGSGVAMPVSVSGDATLDNAGALSLAAVNAGGSFGSAQQVATYTVDTKGRLTASGNVTIDDNTKLPKAGGTMTGAIAMAGNNITGVGNIAMNTNKTFLLSNLTNAEESALIATPLTVADKGKTWFNASTNSMMYWDGSSAKALGVSGAGITSINGSSVGGQTIVSGTTGTDLTISTVGGTGVTTVNLPTASATNRGALASADFTAFSNKLTSVLPSANIFVGNGSNVATPVSMSGDATIDNTGALTLANTVTAGTKTKITYDAKGRVTAGTTLASTDIPSLDTSILTTGALPIARGGTNNGTLAVTAGGVVYTDGTKLMNVGAGTTGQVLSSNAAGAPTWINASTGTVTSASVVSANGFAGTVATATTTPAITISTSVTGLLKGNGTAISAATSGTDYSAGTSALGTGILKSTSTTGALTIAVASDFPILNQNTTGTAANVTGVVAPANGGTGLTGYTTGDLLYANSATTLAKLPAAVTAGFVLTNTGTGSAPTWAAPATSGTVTSITAGTGLTGGTITTSGTIGLGTELTGLNGLSTTGVVKRTGAGAYTAAAVSLTADVSGTLPVANGGTGATSFTNNTLIQANGAGVQASVTAGGTGSLLQQTVTGPVFTTAAYPTSTTGNQLLFSSANNVVGGLTSANDGTLITSATGVPSISSTLPLVVQGNITKVGTVTTGTWNGTAVGATFGGTGLTSFTTGDLLYASSATTLAKLPAAATVGYVLTNGGTGTAPTWSAPTGSGTVNSGSANQLAYYAGPGTAVSGNANVTVSSGAMTLGQVGTALGSLNVSGNTSGTVTIQPQAAAGTYNFNLPITAGASGAVLTSGGGLAAPMTWTTLAASATTDTTNAGNISSGVLSIARGGTNNGTLPVTAGGVVYTDGTKLMNVGAGTTGQVLSSNTAGAPTWINAATGTVTSASVVSANGFSGTVATATTTPAITLGTTVTGLLKGNGTAISAATSGTDYSAGTSALGTGILKSTTTTGALTIAVAGDFPILNQNTTGTAANVTGIVAAANGGTGQSAYTIGDLLYASSTSALSRLPASTSGYVLTSAGVGTAPTWQAAPSSLPAASGTAALPGYAFSGNTNTGMFGAAANQIGFSTGGTEQVRIDSAGKVGIGTASPSSKLHVVSNNLGDGIKVVGTNAPGINLNNGTYGIDIGVATAGTNYSNTSQPGDSVIRTAGATSNGSLILSAMNATGNIAFTTGSSGSNDTTKMIITNSGNVGIGTTSPGSKLVVYGSQASIISPTVGGEARLNIWNSNTVNQWLVGQKAGSDNFTIAPFTTVEGAAALTVDTAGNLQAFNPTFNGVFRSYSPAAGDVTITHAGLISTLKAASSIGLALGANGAEAMRIDTAGKVGIGTTTPRTTLDVNGTIATKAATNDASSTIDGYTGNIHYTTNSCGAFQFNNLKDGASYMFVVQGATAATCTFTGFSDAGTTALTVHMPPDNGNTVASKHTIFNLTVVGTHVYVAWTPGY